MFNFRGRTNEHCHQIEHIGINLGAKFHFKQTVLISWIKYAQRVFPVEDRMNEYHHRNKCIWIRLGPKFHFKQTIFYFMGQICSKMVFSVKNRKK